mgnify:CR=1 FL=1
MVMIEITEDKFDDLYDNIESMLGFGSKAMSCLKKMKQERMGERMPDYRDDWRREREEPCYMMGSLCEQFFQLVR